MIQSNPNSKRALATLWNRPQALRLTMSESTWLAFEAVTVFAIFFGSLATVQYATAALLGTDGYYHIKIGYLMRTEGWRPIFDHLPYTILNVADYYDHHYLYHLWLGLFAWGDPLADG